MTTYTPQLDECVRFLSQFFLQALHVPPSTKVFYFSSLETTTSAPPLSWTSATDHHVNAGPNCVFITWRTGSSPFIYVIMDHKLNTNEFDHTLKRVRKILIKHHIPTDNDDRSSGVDDNSGELEGNQRVSMSLESKTQRRKTKNCVIM